MRLSRSDVENDLAVCNGLLAEGGADFRYRLSRYSGSYHINRCNLAGAELSNSISGNLTQVFYWIQGLYTGLIKGSALPTQIGM